MHIFLAHFFDNERDIAQRKVRKLADLQELYAIDDVQIVPVDAPNNGDDYPLPPRYVKVQGGGFLASLNFGLAIASSVPETNLCIFIDNNAGEPSELHLDPYDIRCIMGSEQDASRRQLLDKFMAEFVYQQITLGAMTPLPRFDA